MKSVLRAFLVVALLWMAPNAWADEEREEPEPCGCDDPIRLTDGLSKFRLDDFEANLHMRLQAWGGWVQDDALLSNGDRMEQPGFRLRRARFGLSGRFFKGLEYGLELDLFDRERAGGPLYEAHLTYNPTHYFGATVGVQKFIFMQSEMMSSGFLTHLDRPLGAFAMAPTYSAGVILFSEPWEDHLTITAAVYNGQRRKESFHQGYEGVGVTFGNRFEGLAYAGRIDLVPLDEMGVGLGDPGQGKKFRVALGGGYFYNDGETISTMGYSAYLHAKFQGAHLFAEFAQDKSEPQEKPTTTGDISTTIERRAVNASVGYVFLKDMLGAAVRFELLDSNLDMDDEGDEWIVTGTLTWYVVGDFLKAQVEYSHREEMHGSSIDNDIVLGGVQLMF